MTKYEIEEFEHVCNVLKDFGIETIDSNGEMRPFNQVMIDIAKLLKEKALSNPKSYQTTKEYIFSVIVGKRYSSIM